ncbi:SagB/ThcOx family dehydrogenase [Amycolatopsis samaneae]|uniref:SagB/ThcOx family dehydrogenase n=1 Tax=Amycolatopsis samaneae TaxID=664691 RepID=A0ABW5GQX8_9PSEU
MRFRRSRHLFCYWRDDELIVGDYRRRTAVAVDPVVVELLSACDDWCGVADVVAELAGYETETVEAAMLSLCHNGLLDSGEPAAEVEEAMTCWRGWEPEAALFHFGTKNANYGPSTAELRAELAGGAPVELFKSYPDAERMVLPRTPVSLREPFGDVLYGRRTHRSFAARPVPLQIFSTLLAAVFGPVAFVDGDEFGALALRTSANGGARQESECYVAVFEVAGVEAGLYHYNALEHSLELVREEVSREAVGELCAGQPAIREAAIVVFLTAVVGRVSAKYRDPRAYRVMLLNAGHVGQTFALAATALGLGAFTTAAFADEEVEALLGIDGVGETVLYVLAAGVPKDLRDGFPEGRAPAGLSAFRRRAQP